MLNKVRAWEAKILRLTFCARMVPGECCVNFRVGTAKSLCIKWKRMGLPLFDRKCGQMLDHHELGYLRW